MAERKPLGAHSMGLESKITEPMAVGSGNEVIPRNSGSVRALKRLSTIAEHYEAIFCDVWGVLHDGETGHAAAIEALIHFRALPGARPRRVILISNAPRPSGAVQRMLDRLHIPREAYDGIVTSGDLAKDLVTERLTARASERIYLLGPDRDRSLLAGLSAVFASADEADCVLCTGPFDLSDDVVEGYRPLLAGLAARGVTMVCANPDLVVEHGARLVTCAGSIAVAFEAVGGTVVYAGKPHALIYARALQTYAELNGTPVPPCHDILAIGDAIRTDIMGASMAGFSSLFVANGIHANEIRIYGKNYPYNAISWLDGQQPRPGFITFRLAW